MMVFNRCAYFYLINVGSSSPPSTKHHNSLQMHNGLDSAVLYEILEMMLLRWGTLSTFAATDGETHSI